MPMYEYNRDTKELKEIRFAGDPVDSLSYNRGYIQGYKDGVKDGVKDDTRISVEFAYIKKANDAIQKLEKIKKIMDSSSYEDDEKIYSYTYDAQARLAHIKEVLDE